MSLEVNLTTMVVLVIFYLALVVKWHLVKRPKMFLLGCAAIILNILLVGFFSIFLPDTWARVIITIVSMVLTAMTFGCAVLTCLQTKLPVNIPGVDLEGDSSADAE